MRRDGKNQTPTHFVKLAPPDGLPDGDDQGHGQDKEKLDFSLQP